MMPLIRFSLALVLWFAVGATYAQPPAPPPPAKYKVSLRYYIPAPRDQHVFHYDAMIRHLQKLGFEFDPPLEKHAETDREDRSKNIITGSIALPKGSRGTLIAHALKMLEQPVVQNLLLVPDGFDLPKEPDDPVMVRLQLAGNFTPDRQRELAIQTRVLLRELGFTEVTGFDHSGYSNRYFTRIVGTIPRAKLDLLQRDLRTHPSGWLGPLIKRDELPSPLRLVNPIQVIEVLPDPDPIKELAPPARRIPDFADKISDDLWALIAKDMDTPPIPTRVQVVFVGNVSADDRDWRKTLSSLAPGFFVERQHGQFVTGIARLDQLKALASAPNISAIRLPRPLHVDVAPTIKIQGDNARALRQTGLDVYHQRGFKGKGVRVGIIDRDFRGWETLVQNKQLPAGTTLVDLTTENDPEIYPRPYPKDGILIGHGTLCAQAAALAAPEAEIVLIRVDIGDPQHLLEMLNYAETGRLSSTIALRSGQLIARAALLTARRGELQKERDIILNDFTDETDKKSYLEFLGPLWTWLYSDRDWHRERMKHLEQLEGEQRLREKRFRVFLREVSTLEGIGILVNALSFQHGYPLGNTSPLSKTLDEPMRKPLWFQSVGNYRGQVWHGLYRNLPGDPTMRFADESVDLPQGRWSRQINFLGWHPYGGKVELDLPEKAKLRIAIQWREPHDPDYYHPVEDEDMYRRPLAELRVQLLRQRDPETKTLPADMFELVARTSALPERLEHLPNSSTYEAVLEATLDKAGRYAIRIGKQVDRVWLMTPHPTRKTPMFQLFENLAPTGIRPLGAPTLPALEKTGELRPRVFVEVIDDVHRVKGRPVLLDFATDAGSIGAPSDAPNVISVGAANLSDRPQPYSTLGSPMQIALARRPGVYAYDELELAGGGAFGASIANAFAAGTAATLQSAGASRPQVILWLRSNEGRILRVPVAKK